MIEDPPVEEPQYREIIEVELNENVYIGNSVHFAVVAITRKRRKRLVVHLGFDAPRRIPILRKELFDQAMSARYRDIVSLDINETVMIGPDISVTVSEIKDREAHLGFDAPKHMSVDRAEIRTDKLRHGVRSAKSDRR